VKVLVTGAGGLLAREVIAALERHHTLFALDRRALDVTDADAVRTTILGARPDWIVHCAAYTNVDGAEAEPGRAHAVNATGTGNVAAAAGAIGARVAYISTDYVFAGDGNRPWAETDPTDPLNAYGRSKLAGEIAVRDALPGAHLVVRTQWLFGRGGPNFATMVLRKAATGEPLTIVDDQVGAPTDAGDVAAALATLITREARGTIHVANDGEASWFELARYVVARAGLSADVRPCSSEEMARPARRPAYSVLDCSRFATLAGAPMRSWRDSVDHFLRDVHGLAGLAPSGATRMEGVPAPGDLGSS
jgi:dTDP-4-dehydrorhamnose reductase